MQASSLNSPVEDHDHPADDEKTPNKNDPRPRMRQPPSSQAESLLSPESCTSTGSPNRVLNMTHIEQQVQEALVWIPASRKQAYEQACHACPDLVRDETPFVRFWRYCNGNAWQAAERLVQYWHDRLSLFGPERAFLPMTQTGSGALSPDDCLALQAGHIVWLPAVSTRTGQDVVFCDRTRCLSTASRTQRLRCLFYMFQCLSSSQRRDSTMAQTKGILFCVLLIQPRAAPLDLELIRTSVALMKRSLPVKVHFHILNQLPPSGARQGMEQAIQRAILSFVEQVRDNWHVHTEEQAGQLVEVLRQELGIPKTSIPARIGGLWKYQQFTQWCRQQRLREQATHISSVLSVPAAASVNVDPHTCVQTNHKNDDDTAAKTLRPVTVATATASTASSSSSTTTTTTTNNSHTGPGLTDEERKRKRLVNVIHSREKRERRKAEHKLLQDEATELQAKQNQLLHEHERLESLLVEAWNLVQTMERNSLGTVAAPSSRAPTSTPSISYPHPMQMSLPEQPLRAPPLMTMSPLDSSLFSLDDEATMARLLLQRQSPREQTQILWQVLQDNPHVRHELLRLLALSSSSSPQDG